MTLTLTLTLTLPHSLSSSLSQKPKQKQTLFPFFRLIPHSQAAKTSTHQLSIKNSNSTSSSIYSNKNTDNDKDKTRKSVIIIGAGLAGLAAATKLNSHNIPFLLLEASDAVGGRVRTDLVDGFLLDRGFQIFITAYPEAQQLLDYDALDLQRFYSGARIYLGNSQFHTVADPLRHFCDALKSLTNPVGSLLDKLLIAAKRIQVLTKSDQEILGSDYEVPTVELLRNIGFSESMVSRFFRPFFGGIFFDTELQTTSKLFDFIFKCLALGDNTLPSKGIEAIPNQLAAKLPPDSILLNTKVVSLQIDHKDDDCICSDVDATQKKNGISVRLENGVSMSTELGVIVAVEQPHVNKLLESLETNHKDNLSSLSTQPKPARSTVCLYFSADKNQIPCQDPVLFLNGSGKGIVNNMFFATNVAPSYGPPEKALVSVSLIGLFEDVLDEDLTVEVVRELSGWFDESMVGSWKHLRTYRIGFAQPNQCPPTDLMKSPRVGSGVYMCGDHLTSATFDGALLSGRMAAEALLNDALPHL